MNSSAQMQKSRTGCCTVVLGLCLAVLAFTGIVAVLRHFVAPDVGQSASEVAAPSPPAPKSPEELRMEQIRRQFSLWDGSHIRLTKLIKERMNDPSSYHHVKTVHWDMGSNPVVRTIFRGRNAFGALVQNSVVARVDLDGNVLYVTETEP